MISATVTRGRGIFVRTVRNIKTILELKCSGGFNGELSLSFAPGWSG
jgi:hypothetical protein